MYFAIRLADELWLVFYRRYGEVDRQYRERVDKQVVLSVDALLDMFLGAILLTVVDCLSRTVATIEIPIGILTSFIGAPFFIFLLFKEVRYDS